MYPVKILYLGLRPKKKDFFHYPVIRTQKCASVEAALKLWSQFTHVVFTSQTSVEYWDGPWDKETIAIGEQTARALQGKGLKPAIAPFATQEGVLKLLLGLHQKQTCYFFLPHSKKARPHLIEVLLAHGISYFALELYDILFQKLEPVPNLDEFDEIIFTSPSTVEGFLRIYQKLPHHKKLTAIGPITQAAIEENNQFAYNRHQGEIL